MFRENSLSQLPTSTLVLLGTKLSSDSRRSHDPYSSSRLALPRQSRPPPDYISVFSSSAIAPILLKVSTMYPRVDADGRTGSLRESNLPITFFMAGRFLDWFCKLLIFQTASVPVLMVLYCTLPYLQTLAARCPQFIGIHSSESFQNTLTLLLLPL